MGDLPKRSQQTLDNNAVTSVVMSLVDIIFAYAYDQRITEEEHNVSIFLFI